jgi:L-fucose isomerase
MEAGTCLSNRISPLYASGINQIHMNHFLSSLHGRIWRLINKEKMSNRLIGKLPRVGIRPVIDGREGGVREALENQTMNMARAAALLIEENLRFPSGEKVECVISDSTIGGVADAARCAEQFTHEGVGVSLTVTPCWCYGTEVMDGDPFMPKAIWGFNGTERPGAVYLKPPWPAMLKRITSIWHLADLQDSDDRHTWCREKILLLNGLWSPDERKPTFPLAIRHDSDPRLIGFFQDYLGMRTEFVDMTEILRRIEKVVYDQSEYEKALSWVRKRCKEGPDPNREPSDRKRKDWEWEIVVKMTLICRDLMIGNPVLDELGFGEEARGRNAIAAGFRKTMELISSKR